MNLKRRHEMKVVSGVEATFVTFSHPSQFKSQKTRRAVRSYVTKRQHQEARLKVARHLGVARDVKIQPADAAGSGLYGQSGTSPRTVEGCLVVDNLGIRCGDDGSTQLGLSWVYDGLEASKGFCRDWEAVGDAFDVVGSLNVTDAAVQTDGPHGKMEGAHRTPSWKARNTLMQFGDLQTMAENYSAIFLPLGWEALGLDGAEVLSADYYLVRLSQEEPALYYARLLFVSGHLAQSGATNKDLCGMLNQDAIASMFEALADRYHKCFEGLVLATGYLALYECLFGDRLAAKMHRVEQRRMIDLQGGIEGLAVPPGVKCVIAWGDVIMSLFTSEAVLVQESLAGSRCGVAQSLQALSVWFPKQYTSLMLHLDRSSYS